MSSKVLQPQRERVRAEAERERESGLELGHLNVEPVQSSQKYTSVPLANQHL